MLRRLDNVDPGVKEFFAPAAKLVLQSEDPQNAMCAALAALSGLMEVPKPRRCGAWRTRLPSLSPHTLCLHLPWCVLLIKPLRWFWRIDGEQDCIQRPYTEGALCARWRSLITQEVGLVTLRVMSRPGRITQPGHVMTIVRNVAGPDATSTVGRVRMLVDRKGDMEVRCWNSNPTHVSRAVPCPLSPMNIRNLALRTHACHTRNARNRPSLLRTNIIACACAGGCLRREPGRGFTIDLPTSLPEEPTRSFGGAPRCPPAPSLLYPSRYLHTHPLLSSPVLLSTGVAAIMIGLQRLVLH